MDNITLVFASGVFGAYAWIRFCDHVLGPWLLRGKGAKRGAFEQGLVEIHNIQALVKDSVDSGVLTAQEEQKLWEAAGRKCASIIERITRA